MIILELDAARIDGDRVAFVGRDYAEGFSLVMPHAEWVFLGEPQRLQFIASGDRLGVRAGWIEGR